jgi:hypothetical protein
MCSRIDHCEHSVFKVTHLYRYVNAGFLVMTGNIILEKGKGRSESISVFVFQAQTRRALERECVEVELTAISGLAYR